MSNLTPAQQRQQSNRTSDGRYTTKTHAEADHVAGIIADTFHRTDDPSRPELANADDYVQQVRQQFLDKGKVPPSPSRILAFGDRGDSVYFNPSDDLSTTIIGQGPRHPQTGQRWDEVNANDHRLLTQQELYQPVEKRQDFFTWRNPDVAHLLNTRQHPGSFGRPEGRSYPESMKVTLKQRGYLDAHQIEGVKRYFDTVDGRTSASPAPQGYQKVSGTVLHRWQEPDNTHMPVHKMMVKDDSGYLTWGQIQATSEAVEGERIEFEANIRATGADKTMGSFTRIVRPKNYNYETGGLDAIS